jgi:hypothetical protein
VWYDLAKGTQCRHRPYSKVLTRLACRAFRRKAKEDLKKGKEPNDKISITYTG